MDKLVSKIVALGVPGLVLLGSMYMTGFAGAAALTTALAILGGPFGMIGGIGVLGVSVLISDGLSKYGFRKIGELVIQKLVEKGESKDSITIKIADYPISKELKKELQGLLAR